ncbi:IS4 family transposase [Fluviibacter phosphoraccumulans]|uniref:IS4 family transposase n=1 Tax=Fluviibacter phosphoraccumulans TaxID=1751046 RepID=A0A679HST1_9RHOO|nr:IS4 family transposase [Fluviibacter phosphoraccumulans]BBU69143.1 IS4 family transposase [Fluviibacter phosphoraccumulans]BBU71701.1 IS4 family transposase [Fluviibacter phosphoraccumulans]BCA65078.1 IS4 family transposase [Fluviibacter phosphoraccumulans]
MNRGKAVFAQLLGQVPFSHFEHLVDVYQANKGIRHFSAWNQFLCLMYAQLTRRSGLRDLVACLNAQRSRLYHIGLRGPVTRSTLADANERRDYRLFEALGQRLIASVLTLYEDADLGLGLSGPVYALDSTTIDLCLSLFPWADFRQTKAAIKAHVLLDLRAAIPVFVSLTSGKVHDVKILDQLTLPTGSLLVADRAYLDFKRLYRLNSLSVGFVLRTKANTLTQVCGHRPILDQPGVVSDQMVMLVTPLSLVGYPDPLRRVVFVDPESAKELVFLTNRFDLAATTIARLYKHRWQIELFFKWLKQNLAVKHFFGNSVNAVKSQIWCAICAYLVVLITIRRLHLPVSPQILLHLIETNIFEKISLDQLVNNAISGDYEPDVANQLILL